MADPPQPPRPPGDPEAPPPDDLAGLSKQVAELRREVRVLRRQVRILRRELQTGSPRAEAPPQESAERRTLSALAIPALAIPAVRVPARLDRFRRRWIQGGEWNPPRSLIWDLAAILVIGLVAVLLRAVNLSDIPPGMHGDEAAVGLEARRILDTGWIGVYSPVAAGTPTGHYYLAAVVFALVDDPIIAVRLLTAIGGTIAVIGLYVLMRRNLGFGSAIVGSVLLAFSAWHIQFSRVGFITGMWPTVVILGMIALMEAIRSRSWIWWAIAGALLSTGIYIYNGHGPFMLVLGLLIGWYLFGWMAVASAASFALVYLAPSPATVVLVALGIVLLALNGRWLDRQRLVNAGAFALSSLVVAYGMINFARTNSDEYFGRGRSLAYYNTEEWRTQSGLLQRAELVIDRYWLFWNRLTFDPIPSGVDISGITPVVPRLLLAICLAGAVIALVRRPVPLVVFSAVIVALTPLSAVMTDMAVRRALVIMPFLALLGGVGAIELFRAAFARRKWLGIGVGLALLALMAKSSYDNYTDFFDATVASGSAQHTFAVDLRETSYFLDSLPDDAYVYFFSERWVLDYDIIALLAPDIVGENRLPKWGGSGGYEIDRSRGTPVFVLMGNDVDRLGEIQRLYPGGEVVQGSILGPPRNGPAYVAYFPP